MPLPTDPVSPSENIQERILRLVGGRRLTPNKLIKAVEDRKQIRKSQVQRAIRDLVAAGELAYTFEHGCTFLEPSFDRPVRVGKRIVLTPPGKEVRPGPIDVVIGIAPGASFGGGRHPTTRLALRGIEFALTHSEKPLTGTGSRMLDIGTGSGVLAIAALKLGIDRGIGIDLDPCALAEAKANAKLNDLEGRILISDAPAESIRGFFTLIAANLRLPTLLSIAPSIADRSAPGAAVVISGIHLEETASVLSVYENQSFFETWRADEDEWMAILLVRK
jgi:ribosomal protein L11 methyltransferase